MLNYPTSIDNPHLGHDPEVNFTVVVDEHGHEKSYGDEEEVEFVLAGALHNEASLLTHAMDFRVEVEAQHQVDGSVENSYHVLVNVDSTHVKSS